MAAKNKQAPSSPAVEPDKELFLDILTKEEKEALLNKKMEEIRKKNLTLQKRHAEIEADKRAAELRGRALTLKAASTPLPDSDMKGVSNGDQRKQSKFSTGRGKRLAQMTQQKLKAPEYEQTKKGPKSPPVDGPPPDPTYNFLTDRSREGMRQSGERPQPPAPNKGAPQRHPRNYGGPTMDNVKTKIMSDKEKQLSQPSSRFRGGPPKTSMDLAMQMTGKERREYVEWKEERQQIDKARIDRQKSSSGDWKREWDTEKVEQMDPEPPASRRMEPGRRPAGRIGSGRFASVNEENLAGEVSVSKVMKNMDMIEETQSEQRALSGAAGGPGGGRGGRGGQRGRGSPSAPAVEHQPKAGSPRYRNTSQSSDDGSRFVEEQNDLLVVKIDNEFAGPSPHRGAATGGPASRGKYFRGGPPPGPPSGGRPTRTGTEGGRGHVEGMSPPRRGGSPQRGGRGGDAGRGRGAGRGGEGGRGGRGGSRGGGGEAGWGGRDGSRGGGEAGWGGRGGNRSGGGGGGGEVGRGGRGGAVHRGEGGWSSGRGGGRGGESGRGGRGGGGGSRGAEVGRGGRGRGRSGSGGRGGGRGMGGAPNGKTVTFKKRPVVFPADELEWDPTMDPEVPDNLGHSTLLNPDAAEFNPSLPVRHVPQTSEEDWEEDSAGQDAVWQDEGRHPHDHDDHLDYEADHEGDEDANETEEDDGAHFDVRAKDVTREKTGPAATATASAATVPAPHLDDLDYMDHPELDDSAESLERFIQEHTFKLNHDSSWIVTEAVSPPPVPSASPSHSSPGDSLSPGWQTVSAHSADSATFASETGPELSQDSYASVGEEEEADVAEPALEEPSAEGVPREAEQHDVAEPCAEEGKTSEEKSPASPAAEESTPSTVDSIDSKEVSTPSAECTATVVTPPDSGTGVNLPADPLAGTSPSTEANGTTANKPVDPTNEEKSETPDETSKENEPVITTDGPSEAPTPTAAEQVVLEKVYSRASAVPVATPAAAPTDNLTPSASIGVPLTPQPLSETEKPAVAASDVTPAVPITAATPAVPVTATAPAVPVTATAPADSVSGVDEPTSPVITNVVTETQTFSGANANSDKQEPEAGPADPSQASSSSVEATDILPEDGAAIASDAKAGNDLETPSVQEGDAASSPSPSQDEGRDLQDQAAASLEVGQAAQGHVTSMSDSAEQPSAAEASAPVGCHSDGGLRSNEAVAGNAPAIEGDAGAAASSTSSSVTPAPAPTDDVSRDADDVIATSDDAGASGGNLETDSTDKAPTAE